VKLRIGWTDGRYSAVPHTKDHAALNLAGVEMFDVDWYEYQNHLANDNAWQNMLRDLSNQQYDLDNPNGVPKP
jgi:hypothetical protein